jgi:hypothetical protein
MAACAAQVFSGITQARFDCLVKTASANGITISGNAGTAVVKHGIVSVTISWNYDPNAQTLTLQYLNPGFLAPCDKVNGMLHDLVDSCP